jgi:hypothetical protein
MTAFVLVPSAGLGARLCGTAPAKLRVVGHDVSGDAVRTRRACALGGPGTGLEIPHHRHHGTGRS